MRTTPAISGGGGRSRLAIAAVATAVAAGVLVLAVRGVGGDPSIGIVRVEAAPTSPSAPAAAAMAPAPVGARMVYELHGISTGGAHPSALLAPHGAAPRSFAVGDTIGPGVVLERIARGHVLLREGSALIRIDLPPRLGGSGEAVAPAERGLKPEPQPPTGELSGAQIALPGGNAPAPLPGDE